jgi:hypothetical protein
MNGHFHRLTDLASCLLLYQGVTTSSMPFVSRKKWPLVAIAGLLVGLAPASVTAQGGARIDRSLRQRLSEMRSTALVNVILTVRAGAKPAVCRALVASGATITSEFSLIEAFGVRLSAESLQTLARDARVVAISSDGAVDANAATNAQQGSDRTDSVFQCPADAGGDDTDSK